MTAEELPAVASDDLPADVGGWRIGTAFASSVPPSASQRFYAVYEGGGFGHPERGMIAAVARGHAADPAGIKGAREAAQLVIHSFAEGYFGALRTLGTKRAAQQALVSINGWLHGQIRNDSGRQLAPVSLVALLLHGAGVGVLQIGTGGAYRARDGQVTPLMPGHLSAHSGAWMAPARAIGLDQEFSVDYTEIEAAAGDKLLLENGLNPSQPETLAAALRLELPPARDACAVVLEVLAAPAADPARQLTELTGLKLRPEPREGDVWDGFVIGKTIYRGRYTVLKLCHDSFENREVVLKIPLPSMLQDEIFTAGFMREAWIGSTVRSDNLVRYIDLPADRRSSLYLVMPYYRGETLEQRSNRTPLVSLPEGVGIALKLCEAVQDLASIQIIHRDLKPENIMLLPNNEVRLLDLGLAYLPGIDLRDATKPGGTLRYMAPELLKGVQANPRTEVYALAVTIYRMFARGAYPFGQREGTPLRRLRPDLPRWLGKVIQKGLMPDPAERFADAGEMAKALREGLVSGPVDEPEPLRFPLSRLQLWQALAIVFAIGFLLLLTMQMRR